MLFSHISPRRIYAFFLRHLYPLRRDFDLLSDMLYWPLIDLTLWGITGMWLVKGSAQLNLVASLLLGLLLWNVLWRSQSEISRNLIDEIWNNNLVNLFSTPLSLAEWIIGVLLLSFIKMAVTVSVLTPLILALYHVNVFELGWWIFPFFAITTLMGWVIGFISAGIVIRYGPKVQTIIWTLPGILLPFSAIYFPVAQLPSVLQPIAMLIPTTYVLEAMRAVLTGTAVSVASMLTSLALVLAYMTLAIVYFVRMFEKSRELGLNRFG